MGDGSMLFFEALEHITCDDELFDIFSPAEILKVVASRENKNIHIYIKSRKLIYTNHIRKMEELLYRQLFRKTGNKIYIEPYFELDESLSFEKLFSMYFDSILEEIKEASIVTYYILKQAEIKVDNNVIIIRARENCVVEDKCEKIKEYLIDIFKKRFGYDIAVRFEFIKTEEKKKVRLPAFLRENDDEEEDDENYIDPSYEFVKADELVNAGSHDKNGEAENISDEMWDPSNYGYDKDDEISDDISGENYIYNDLAEINRNVHSNISGNAGHMNVKSENINGQDGNNGAQGSENGTDNKNKSGMQSKYQKGKNYRLPKDPSVIYGRNFEGDVIPISDIIGEIGEVVIRGMVRSIETRPIGNDKTLITFVITDFTDSIKVKIFSKNDQLDEILENLKNGSFYMLKGMALTDTFERDITVSSVVGIKKIEDFRIKRMDRAPQKRVELHAHTMMSDMDAVVDVKKLVRRAFEWGHPAVAITDHGVVQAFPEANHALNPKDYSDPEEQARAKAFKVIYGMEAYLVDDLKEVVTNGRGQSLTQDDFVVFDIETTGLSKNKDKIIEIGAVKVSKGEITDKFSTFVNPQIPIPYEIEQLTSISNEMVADAPVIEKVLPEFLEFCKGCVLVAHNANFDVGFIIKNAKEQGLENDFTYIDTVGLSRILLPDLSKYKLDHVAKALNVSLENHHRAVDDAGATAEIFVKLIQMLKEKGIDNVNDIDKLGRLSAEAIRKLPSYHAILLAKNEVGRVNLYRMVSKSHIDYFNKRPKIPKSLLMECREGIIVGSACEAGEVFRAVLTNQSDEVLDRIVKFYDYLEIQPLTNNEFLIRSDKSDERNVTSIEDLKNLNRRIVELGEEYNKPVVATCDVHFLDPEDEVYRRILLAGQGYKDADMQPALYFRTTEEMLEEFSYLGREKAEEVVITNTNLIADMIEKISPVRPDKCPPVLPNSDEELRRICYERAHSIYGEELPKPVKDRLEHELHSIISNGFAVMYIIAQKLVWKSNEDGYLVGSRGSVGSSFVATMAGITEVNPLPPHYYCSNCHYSDFDSEEVKKYAGSSGCDMPDKYCPVCGKLLEKDGHDIPFETFLGFNGDKEPDIDLNFSGEYQSKAHEYTEVIFGKGHTFRAGTIGTLADKTAYGYVKKYFEEHGVHKRHVEIERLVEGLLGVRRTTGQHPGGIVVLPHGEEIYSFTPVQRPANDMTSKTITTHFDYHSIDHNLLKLDILGHDDPTMIRMLEDLTGLDARKIKLDDKKVLSLFHDTSALGIKPEDIGGCELGCLGIPEFGTDFVMQMVKEAQPKSFSDLVRISGLSHGTDVWLNNAQDLIRDGICTLSTCICTRDDIMLYLINAGMEPGLSFKIMESVRKGKGLTPEMEEAMLAAGIPDWYIASCKKIKYMFPKAHAAAYVMMAFRIAYFKVYYPLAYYCAYFSIRASAFNYELMCQGRDYLESVMADYKRRYNSLSKKEQDTYKDMRIVQEMYARGFSFVPIDIYKAKAKKFQIVGDKLMPSLNSIDGMGETAANAVEEAAKEGKFLSIDDFKTRCKVSSTVVDTMVRLGLLGDLPQSNQMSLLDFLQ